MRFVVLLSLALALNATGIFGCKDQCCDLNCWEQCFADGSSGSYAAFYQQIYQIVQTVRNLHSPCSKPHGTCFLLDSSAPVSVTYPPGNQLLDFERNLASIIALTQPVSNECNPFFVNKFYRNGAGYGWHWQCQDKCNAARTLATLASTSQNGNQPSAIGSGCYLCDHAFNNNGLSCSADTKNELLIAFANSGIYTTPFTAAKCNKYKRVIIGTTPASIWTQLASWASPGLAYQLQYSNANLQATKSLLKCLNYRCCPNTSPNQFPLPARAAGDQQRFTYNTKNDEKTKDFTGTIDQFENILNELDSDDNEVKCRTSRDCPRNMRCLKGRCVGSFTQIGGPIKEIGSPIKGRDAEESLEDKMNEILDSGVEEEK